MLENFSWNFFHVSSLSTSLYISYDKIEGERSLVTREVEMLIKVEASPGSFVSSELFVMQF